MAVVDDLQIKIQGDAVRANDAIDKLVGKLDRLSTALGSLSSKNLNSLSTGVTRLTTAMTGMNNVNTADFTRLAKNIEKLATLDSAKLSQSAGSIHQFINALGGLNNIKVSDSAKNIGDLARGIAQLGYKSSTKAIQNIPQLATAMHQLMTTLSTAPKVSQNIINMTNALAALARTGSSSGRAATSLGRSLETYTRSTKRASKGTFSLAGAIGKIYATYWLLFRAMGKIKDAIDISSQLTEVQNVVDVTFGKMSSKVEDFTKNSIEQFGMSELSVKKYASTFQAMGSAMGIDTALIGTANKFLNKQTDGYVGLSNSMADVSLNLTKLTADMASFYNVEQKDVADDLASIFTGSTRPLRQYGIDLTQATLKEWALSEGMNANIQSMTQAEKAMLRYQYVLAHTGAAQGDFARTADTWANQTRILKQNFEQLASIIGGTFINMLKPLVKALNNAMSHIIAFAQVVSDALGKIFGWTYEVGGGGVASDMEYAADESEALAGGLADAEKNAKKLKTHLLGIDELNVFDPSEAENAGGGSGGAGASGGGAGASGGQWVKADSIFKQFESEIDTLYELGEYIGNALSEAMEGIDWEKSYEKARNWGKGLADFLNGLISPRLFENLGKTVAGSLNTALHFLNSFGKTFEWEEFGVSLSASLKGFFEDWDAELTGETLSTFAKGLLEAAKGAIDKLKDDKIFEEIGQKIVDFICGIDWTGIVWDLGGFFLSLADAIAQFPIDLANGIMQEIADKIFGEKEVEIKLPELSGELADTSTILNPNSSFGEKIFASFDLATKLQEELEKVNILFEQKRQEFLAWWDENIGAFWEEHVSPWFTEEKWLELYDTIRSSLETKWGEVKEWWSGTAIVSWWEEDVKPWFKLEKWLELLDTLKKSFKTKWNETVVQWDLDIKNWWNINVSPWFTKTKWETLLKTIPNEFKNAFEKAKEWVKEKVQSMWDFVSGIISKMKSAISSIGSSISSAVSKVSSIGGKSKTVKGFAGGGYPSSASLFWAGENGIPEILGTINGKTAVAGGAEITGIRDAVYDVGNSETTLLRMAVSLLETIAAKDTNTYIDGRELVNAYDERKTRNGFSFT